MIEDLEPEEAKKRLTIFENITRSLYESYLNHKKYEEMFGIENLRNPDLEKIYTEINALKNFYKLYDYVNKNKK